MCVHHIFPGWSPTMVLYINQGDSRVFLHTAELGMKSTWRNIKYRIINGGRTAAPIFRQGGHASNGTVQGLGQPG